MMTASLPKKRWKILSSAILNKINAPKTPILCEFPDYGLIQCMGVNTEEEAKGESVNSWFTIKLTHHPQISLKLGLLRNEFTLEDITGFNNTGNVRLWPSEIALSQYLLDNPSLYSGKTVLELGGGMTCLAGLCIASSIPPPSSLHLTDGNPNSVNNIQRNIEANTRGFPSECRITFGELRWDDEKTCIVEENKKYYDLIICSDCLFFKAGRRELAEFIVNGLTPKEGRAVIVAPRRSNSLQEFLQLLLSFKDVEATLESDYSSIISGYRASALVGHPEYKEDIHYPHLILVCKN